MSISTLIHASTDDLELYISQARLLLVNDLPALLQFVENPKVVISMSFDLSCNKIWHCEDIKAALKCPACSETSWIVYLCAFWPIVPTFHHLKRYSRMKARRL